MWRAVVILACASCGRFGFDDHGSGPPQNDAPLVSIDAPEGGLCASDSNCAPCQRCDTGVCTDETISQLYLGHRSTCFLGKGGSRWCVGEGSGLGGKAATFYPQRIEGEDGWTSLALGYTKSIGIRNGQLYSWGNSSSVPMVASADGTWIQMDGQLGAFCTRHGDGSINCDGSTPAGNWLMVAAGDDAYCAIKSDHTLWCWGTELDNMLGHGVVPTGTMVTMPTQVGTALWNDISMGEGLSCGRQTDNTIYCWGNPTYTGTGGVDTMGVPVQISTRTSWVSMEVKWKHGCARKTSNDIECWGADDQGFEIVPGATFVGSSSSLGTQWDDLRLGGHHSCGLKLGKWYCWGWNAAGQLGLGDLVTRQSASLPLCSAGGA